MGIFICLFLSCVSCAVECVRSGGNNIIGGTDDVSYPVHHWNGEMHQIAWKPRLYHLKGFLSPEECDFLMARSEGKLRSSRVVDNNTGKQVPSDVRTSYGTFFHLSENPVVAAIEQRVSDVSMLPIENQEALQILRYQDGQKYSPHTDYFHDPQHTADSPSGQRVLTVLMYLSEPEEGGETVFPKGEQKVTGPGWSECARQGMAVHPRKGDAVMFYSLHPDGSPDPYSLHGSCPTTKGTKWSATKWIHTKALNGCQDTYKDTSQCFEWAQAGECQANKAFMLKECKKSCKAC